MGDPRLEALKKRKQQQQDAPPPGPPAAAAPAGTPPPPPADPSMAPADPSMPPLPERLRDMAAGRSSNTIDNPETGIVGWLRSHRPDTQAFGRELMGFLHSANQAATLGSAPAL